MSNMARIKNGCIAAVSLAPALLCIVPALAEPARGPLRIHRDNPRYFEDGTGRAVFLAGAHVWSNLQDELGQPPVNFTERLDLLEAVPQEAGTEVPSSAGFCLYNPGERYLVYEPKGGPLTIQCPAGLYECEWFNPAAGKVAKTDRVKNPGGKLRLTPPFEGPAVLFLQKPSAASAAAP